MSLSSRRQKVGVVTAAVVAAAVLGYAVVSETRRESADTGAATVLTGTVSTQPTKDVDVVALTTPAQAAIAVSSRLFRSSELAVLSGRTAADRTAALAAATKLRVPVLLDDPAAVAELTRLRSTRVLTFGTTTSVAGAVPAATNAAALARQVDGLLADETSSAPRAVDAVVLMRSDTTFDVAAATARVAGATVVETTQGDLRRDAKTSAVLAKKPDAAVIALGAPFSGTLEYAAAAVRNRATQIGGGYFATTGRTFVGLHGRIGDPESGMLGEQDTQGSISIIKSASARFAANDDKTVVPMFEIVATSASAQPGTDKDYSDETPVADLVPVVDAAEKAGLYVLIDLQPGSGSFLQQAKAYESLLARKNVGLTLEPQYRVAPGTNPVPGRGSATAAEIDQTSQWLADLTAEKALPQKLFVVRESRAGAVTGRSDISTTRPELAVVLDVAVTGTPDTKLAAWAAARDGAPQGAAFGWLQDRSADRPMFTVNQTYRQVSPYPSVVTYQ